MRDKSLIDLIEIPEVFDDCYLYFAQTPDHIPFTIKRVYYILKSDTKLQRGFHTHKKTKQMLFCIQGSIKIILDNGREKASVVLDKANLGLFIDKMIWHQMYDFKKNTILLIFASKIFDEKDYIRNYEQFKKKARKIS